MQTAGFSLSSCGGRAREVCGVSFIRALTYSWELPPQDVSIYLPHWLVYSISLSFSFPGIMIVPILFGCCKVPWDSPSKMLCMVLGIQRCSINVSCYWLTKAACYIYKDPLQPNVVDWCLLEVSVSQSVGEWIGHQRKCFCRRYIITYQKRQMFRGPRTFLWDKNTHSVETQEKGTSAIQVVKSPWIPR